MNFSYCVIAATVLMVTPPQQQAEQSQLKLVTLAPNRVSQVLTGLRSPDPRLQAAAARDVAATPELQGTPEIRSAVLSALARATSRESARVAAEVAGKPQVSTRGGDHGEDNGLAMLALLRAAAKFEGPDIVTALLPYVGTGPTAQRRIARHGPAALDDLIRIHREGIGASHPSGMRMGAVMTMAIVARQSTLTPDDHSRLNAVARQSLASRTATEAVAALYLGAALRDTVLLNDIKRMRAEGFSRQGFTPSERNALERHAGKAFSEAGIR